MPRGPQHPRRRTSLSSPAALPASTSLSVSADLPEIVLEWLPDARPSDADGVWVSLTPYLVDGSCTRGRSVEFDQFQAGSMSFTLESLDRTFDPDNTAGAYYGKLLPNKQVRLGLKWRGTTYPVFRGYVQSWGSTTVSDTLFRTTVQVRDAFMRFEQIKLPSSPWATTVPTTSPSAWFRLNETDTQRVSDSSGNGSYGLYDNATQGAQGLIPGDSDGAVSFAHTNDNRVSIQNPNLLTGFPFTLSAIIKVDGSDSDGVKTIFAAQTPFVFEWFLSSTNSGLSALTGIISYSALRQEYVPLGLDDNQPHHVVWAASSANSWKFYIDGVLCTATVKSSGTPAWYPTQPSTWAIGCIPNLNLSTPNGFGTAAANGTIDEFVVWKDVALDATTVSALYDASIGWDGDDSGTRVGRLLDAIGWADELRDVSTGVAILGYGSWSDGASALSVLQTWADSELGAFFIDRSGRAVWRSRHYPLLNRNSTQSQATFGDASANAITITEDGLDLSRDSTLIRNPVQASRRNGISITLKDDYLADQVYGNRDWSAPTSEENADATVYDRAWWMLSRFKEESLRLKSMTVDVRAQPQWWDTVLGLELGDRITVKRTPLGLGSQIEVDQIIEQIGWGFSKYALTPTFTASPVDTNVGDFLILDDATEGLIDTFDGVTMLPLAKTFYAGY